MKSESASYKAAGVDITAGYRAVELMKKHVARTVTPGVIGGLGGFGGLFQPELAGMKAPVLVSGTDGVGTKLKIAFLMDKHDTVGIDCVAMCVNDVVCSGAAPLFFLDYIACGKNVPERIADIVAGVAEGCVQAGAALVGGETAEMPGFYPEDEYDLAGFTVGLVDEERILDSSAMREGDALIALPSSGVHSNGFSLVRRIFDVESGSLERYEPELGRTLGEALLEPTRIYVKPVLSMLCAARVSAVSHITGGGFYENIPRALAPGFTASACWPSWPPKTPTRPSRRCAEAASRPISAVRPCAGKAAWSYGKDGGARLRRGHQPPGAHRRLGARRDAGRGARPRRLEQLRGLRA